MKLKTELQSNDILQLTKFVFVYADWNDIFRPGVCLWPLGYDDCGLGGKGGGLRGGQGVAVQHVDLVLVNLGKDRSRSTSILFLSIWVKIDRSVDLKFLDVDVVPNFIYQ